MSKTYFIGHPIYRTSSYGAGHPLSIARVSAAEDLARALGWLNENNYRTGRIASDAELRAFHDPSYLAALRRAESQGSLGDEEKQRFNLGRNGNPIFPEIFSRPATACGSGQLAVELLAGGARFVHNPAGGTHHALADRASGFCYLNEPVLSIKAALARGISPVFYLDLDAHHGDGVEIAFADEPRVFTLSIHEAGRWPMTQPDHGAGSLHHRGGGQARNLPVPANFNDSEMAFLMESAVLPLIERARPQLIVVQGGVDALADDPQSQLGLSNGALWRALRLVLPLAPKLLLLGGGGYNPFAVARAWAGFWAILSGQDMPEVLPPEAQEVLGALTWRHRLAKTAPQRWVQTLADPPLPGLVRDEVRRLPPEVLKE